MFIYPAIDIIGGQAVRLTKGNYNTAEVLSDDPYSVAEGFKAQGATRLHVVDLDGAKVGETKNFDVISKIVGELNMFVEVGGGIRDEHKIEDYLAAGASRVILGTVAVENFGFVESVVSRYGDKIAVGVDCKDGCVAVKGWREVSKIPSYDFVRKCRYAGVTTVIFTDIDTDGAMSGTNIAAFEKLSEIEGLKVIASGGISDLDEIKKLKNIGVEGVILGKALYHGLINLTDAIKTARDEYDN